MSDKNLLISFGIRETDGRLLEIEKVMTELDPYDEICMTKNKKNCPGKIVLHITGKYLSVSNYCRFLKSSIDQLKKIKYKMVFIDNFFAAPLGLFVKKYYPEIIVVQDCREFYNVKDIKSIAGKILVKAEAKLIKKADMVITANEERAKLTKEKFDLKCRPVVYENIRFFDAVNNGGLSTGFEKFDSSKCNVISTGGVSVVRGTLDLIKAFSNLDNNYMLYIFGGGTEGDLEKAENCIDHFGLRSQVKLMNKVPLYILKEYVDQSDIGIVHYHKNDLNNLYCASGKVYEFVGEELPIVTTENPPLKRMCEELHIGQADDNYYIGIQEVYNNYSTYKNNVIKAKNLISSEKNNRVLAKKIRRILEGD